MGATLPLTRLNENGETGSRAHHLTMAYARAALERITALELPADPLSFEVWYTYASGRNPALNQALNEKLDRKGRISADDLDEVYSRYFLPYGFAQRIDDAGTKVADMTAQIVTMIQTGLGSAAKYQETLAGANENLARVKDGKSLRAVIATLVSSTTDMEQQNSDLQVRLDASRQEISKLQSNLDMVRVETRTDALTTIANRKHFDETLAAAIAHAEERGSPLSLLMIDVDHFKKFNDSFGHITGDQVLQLIALLLKQTVRGQDIPARYGGEEFAVILPKTAVHQAVSVAENIRTAIAHKELVKRSTGKRLGRITISIGVAEFRPGEAAQSLIERADSCLYAAKDKGRNRVSAEPTDEAAH